MGEGPPCRQAEPAPQQIAQDAIAAARAGASVVHIHVRDPETTQGSRETALYEEVVRLIDASDVDPVINLTAGMGGDLALDPSSPAESLGRVDGTDLVSGLERLKHVETIRPEICTLDCGTLNFGDGSQIYVGTPDMVRQGAARIRELGVKPELELFDTGNLWFADVMRQEGLLAAPPMYQLCMGIPYGAPADPGLLNAMVNMIPEGTEWTSFAIGRNQLPWVAQSVLLGGHARVGLEDNLYLRRGVKATNAQLTQEAVKIIDSLGQQVATPDEAREILGIENARPQDKRAQAGAQNSGAAA